MKDLDDIYSGGIKVIGEEYHCSVCGKKYKKESTAQKHIDKRSCHSTYDVFGDTEYESYALSFYKNILVSQGKKSARPTLNSFRKSSLYKNTVMYIVSCMMNEVDYGFMYSFLEEIVGFKYPNKILLEGQDMKWVKEFRCFLHNHPEVTESDSFYKAFKEELHNDEDFLVEAIEKAKISIGYVQKKPKLLDAVSSISIGYQMRIMDVIEESDSSKWRA